jgi:hypothetical protein
MAFLSSIWRYGIWVSIPVFILSVLLLVDCITGVIRTVRNVRLLSVPLVDLQEIEFSEAGKVVLCLEGPLFTPFFRKLTYELIGPNGMPVKSRIAWFRARSSSFSQVKMELKVYEIAFPGRYVFKIAGLEGTTPPFEKHHMVFTRPHLGISMIYVIGIVIAGMLTTGSIVLFFLRLISVVNGS